MIYPKVSIIILNWNGLKDTIECLDSLQKITYPNYEVMVVDNGSKGNEAGILRKKYRDYIKLIANKDNLGFAGGNNQAIKQIIREGQSDYVLLLNNDTIVDKEFLSELVKVAESDSNIAMVGPKIYYYDHRDVLQTAGARINWWTGFPPLIGTNERDVGQYDNIKEVDYVSGCALLVKKEVIAETGMLDKNYFMYYEETDWCARVKKAGYLIKYVPKAKIWHKIEAFKKRTDGPHIYRMTRNRFLFMKKNATSLQYFVFLVYFFTYYFPKSLIKYLFIIRDKTALKSHLLGIKEGILIKI